MSRSLILISLCFVFALCCNSNLVDYENKIINEKVLLGSHLNRVRLYLHDSGLSQNAREQAFVQFSDIASNADALGNSYGNHYVDFKEVINQIERFETSLSSGYPGHYVPVSIAHQNKILNDACNCTYCYVFDGYPQSKYFLAYNASCDFLNELLGNDRYQTVSTFLDSYDLLDDNLVDRDSFLYNTLVLLTNQTRLNPSYYVSHGTDHSIRVMGWQYNLREMVDSYLTKNYGCTRGTDATGVNGTCTYALMFNGLVHDTGYINIAGTNVKKFAHSVGSFVLDQVLFAENNNMGNEIVSSAATSPQLTGDFLHAILTHNNDDQDCLWKTGPNYGDNCLSPSTPLMQQFGFPSIIPRNYTEPHAEMDPMSFLIRISDNMDSASNRLTEQQDNEDFMRYLCFLYTDNELREDDDNATAIPPARQRAIEANKKVNPQWDPTPIMGMINRTDLQSFLFFYSVWMVTDLNLSWNPNFTQFTLNVNIRDAAKNDCNHCDLGFKSHPGPALYQINRLAISMHSLFIHNTSFLDRVTVQLSEEVPGLVGTTFPLKQFTMKQVYSENGPVPNSFICGDCSSSVPLTNSPEQCVQLDGSITDCANDTQLGSPYADLSYDISIRYQPKDCAPQKVTHNKHPWWFWLLVAGIPVGIVVVLLIAIFTVVRRRRTRGYMPINNN